MVPVSLLGDAEAAAARETYRVQAEAERQARIERAKPQPGDNPALVRRRNTRGTPHTAGVAVTTWADGWGAYGATVTGARDTDHARRVASARIRARFADADGWGSGFRLRLDLVGAEAPDGRAPAVHRFAEHTAD